MHPNQHPHHQQQQLQPYGTGSNSAHSSPLKRAPQAVSPLASPMESRRIFMATQQTGEHQQQPGHPPSMGLSALQLGYAVPACRLLVDPQTGQQYFVPAPQPLPTAAPAGAAAFFQPALFYNQPAAAFFPSHAATAAHHQPHPATTAAGTYLYAAHQPPHSSITSPAATAAGFYAQHPTTAGSTVQLSHQQLPSVPISSHSSQQFVPIHHLQYGQSQPPPHRSQSPTTTIGGYRVEIPPSTVEGSIYGGDAPGEGENNSGGYQSHYHHQKQPSQNFERRDHCRLSTESRTSSTRGGGLYGTAQFGDETNSNPDDSYSYGRSPPPQHRQQYPPQQQHPSSPQHHNNNFKQQHSPSSLTYHQQQQLMTLSAGGHSSSTESTSGFASVAGGRSRTRTFGDEPKSPGPHQQQQPPQSPMREQRMFGGGSFPSPPPMMREEDRERQQQHYQEKTQYEELRRSPPRMKAIRMDIDLSRPLSPPENASTTRPMAAAAAVGKQRGTSDHNSNSTVSVRVTSSATVLRTAPPTAFTISFNDGGSNTSVGQQQQHVISSTGVADFSLQEAARHAPKGRRLMAARQSVPPRGQQHQHKEADSGSECGDPKRWLFRKMMLGRASDGTSEGTNKEAGETTTEHQQQQREDREDLASEAGTYVVDSRKPNNLMTNSQISGNNTQRDAISSSSSTASSRTSSTGTTPSPGPQPPVRPSLSVAPVKRSLMTDLRRLRESGQQPVVSALASGKQQQQQSKKLLPSVQKPSAPAPKLPPPVPAHRKAVAPSQQQQVSAPNINNSNNRLCRTANPQQQQQTQAFRPQSSRCRSEPRNDGGRFSMRPTASGRPLPALGSGRGPAPMRQQSANAVANNKPPQRSPEMLAWLRRKEYDPRKSAAAEQQQQQQQLHQLKAQEAFAANRSMSAIHSTESSTQQKQSPFSRWRAAQGYSGASMNRSHDDLSRLGESLDEESLLGGPDSCTSSLQRTVDELTQKCHKSIALLKLCNQSSLSPSVEHLLERVVQSGGSGDGEQMAGTSAQLQRTPTSPTKQQHVVADAAMDNTTTGSTENISDRLERLSSAFDVIQKYLEEQTVAGGQAGGGAGRTMSGTFTKKTSKRNGGEGGGANLGTAAGNGISNSYLFDTTTETTISSGPNKQQHSSNN